MYECSTKWIVDQNENLIRLSSLVLVVVVVVVFVVVVVEHHFDHTR